MYYLDGKRPRQSLVYFGSPQDPSANVAVRSGLDEQPSVGPPPTRIVGASEWPAAAALSGFSAGAGVCQAFPPPLPNESKAT